MAIVLRRTGSGNVWGCNALIQMPVWLAFDACELAFEMHS
jgi:hypothetical protein